MMGKLIEAAQQVGGVAWPMLVRWTFVHALFSVAGEITFLVLAILAFKRVWAWTPDTKRYDDEELLWGGRVVLLGIIVIVAVIALASLFEDCPKALVPDGAAVRAIISKDK